MSTSSAPAVIRTASGFQSVKALAKRRFSQRRVWLCVFDRWHDLDQL
jgi:hypothetical protein